MNMKRISRKLTLFVGCMDRFINRLLFIFLLVMATIAFAQVCTRYILNFSIVWSEELCRYLFIWTIFLAIPSLLFRAALTSFDVLHARARGWKRQFLDLIVAFGELVFLWILYWGSYPFVLRQLRQVSTALPISMALVYVVVPISAVLGIFVTIERILFSLCAGEG